MKKIMLSLLAWSVFAGSPAGAADVAAPDVLARAVTDEVLKIVRADKELQAGNTRKVVDLIESKVAPHFEFTSMTRLAMGRNWSQANTEQRKALTQEFRMLLVRTYTTAFTQYKDQMIEYRPLKLGAGETDVVVKSLIKQTSGQPVAIDYRMEKTDRGWKVYDVKIEGISLVENYRNTFNSEVQRSGIDGLVKSLADRNRAQFARMEASGK